MNYTIDHKSNEQKDRRKSAVITAVVAILAFLIIFFYKFTRLIPQEEVVTTMLINFGDNQNGDGAEEPANQKGVWLPTRPLLFPNRFLNRNPSQRLW